MNINLLSALKWRYATKNFDAKKTISNEDLQVILEAGNLAPSAYGLQPFRIINIIDKDLREQIKSISYNQDQVTDASALLVLAIRTDIDEKYIDDYVKRIAEIRGVTLESLSGFKKSMFGDMSARTLEARNTWSSRQAYIALGTMISAASELGIDTGPMEGFDKTKLDNLLKLSEINLASIVYLTLGYREDADPMADWAKVRLPLEDFVINK